MSEPVTLGGFLFAAFSVVGGGMAEAMTGDAWAGLRRRYAVWRRLPDKTQRLAFEAAVAQASAAMRDDTVAGAELVFMALSQRGAGWDRFRQLAVTELVFSARPNIGRLIDQYKRYLSFEALVSGAPNPAWAELEAPLRHFFSDYLVPALERQTEFRGLLPSPAEREQLSALWEHVRESRAANERLVRIEQLLEHLACGTAGAPLTEAELEQRYERYSEWVVHRYGQLDLGGFALNIAPRLVSLADIFVRPFCSLDLPNGSVDDALLTIRDKPLTLLIGDPGSGKSTLVCFILWAAASRQTFTRLGLDEDVVPILFPVGSYTEARRNDPNLAPLPYLAEYYASQSLPALLPIFERALEAGRALVLIDGLDEAGDSLRDVAQSIDSFVHAYERHGNRFVATCRPHREYELSVFRGRFTHIWLLPLSDGRIADFLSKWRRLPSADQKVMDALEVALTSEPRLMDLARSPLLLTLAVLVGPRTSGQRIDRVALYQRLVVLLAELWNQRRRLSPGARPLAIGEEPFTEALIYELLGPLALWAHRERPTGLLTEQELIDGMKDTAGLLWNVSGALARNKARSVLRLAADESGLLRRVDGRHFRFFHPTVGEYLTARGLLLQQEPALETALAGLATSELWSGVLRLAIASAEPAERRSALLLAVLGAPAEGEVRGKPAVLAGECLLDLGDGPFLEARAVAQTQLGAIAEDPSAIRQTRLRACQVLGRLGDHRLLDLAAGDAPAGRYWCQVDPGPFYHGDDQSRVALSRITLPYRFCFGRYPVTNFEFRTFITMGGYDLSQLWWSEAGRAYLQGRLSGWSDAELQQEPNLPVRGLTWYEAAAYASWLTVQGRARGWLGADEHIRLPTSLEWERVARHVDKRPFPWGTELPDAERANGREARLGRPSPVGAFPAGAAACGALDMAGNVPEWLATLYVAPDALQPHWNVPQEELVLCTYSDYTDTGFDLGCGVRLPLYPGHLTNPGVGLRLVRAAITAEQGEDGG